ncbi:hepatic sodium/bile acid cotransporter-like [Watersipora subatra]|uniref:hepatic sodium/bile acid cotransporter-like n=1 Tax=Watersipora subatra TaxID=2589382 RepID=UPI00355BBE6A
MVSPCQYEMSWNVTGNTSDSDSLRYSQAYSNDQENCYNVSFYSTAVFIGYSNVKFYARIDNSTEETYIDKVLLRSVRPRRTMDLVYKYATTILVVVVMLATGNDLQYDTIKQHLKKPKAPLIAMISQFTIMPLIAYGIIWLMGYTGGKALGFFTLGCSPGGGTSNIYAKLSNGDLSLSVTMTTLSTIASLGMLPLWLYTLGSTIPADEGVDKIQIPFLNILQSLACIVIPLAIGALMKYKLPRVALLIRKWLKVLFIFALVFFVTFVIYVKMYIFVQWDGELMLAACMLPYGGYVFGGLFAWICRFNWTLIKTISIETGMQSAAVCFLVVMSVSGQPDMDLAIILPTASTLVAGWPFFVILPIYLLRQKILEKRKAQKEKDLENYEDSNEKSKFELESGESSGSSENGSDTCSDTSSERQAPAVEMKLLNQ